MSLVEDEGKKCAMRTKTEEADFKEKHLCSDGMVSV